MSENPLSQNVSKLSCPNFARARPQMELGLQIGDHSKGLHFLWPARQSSHRTQKIATCWELTFAFLASCCFVFILVSFYHPELTVALGGLRVFWTLLSSRPLSSLGSYFSSHKFSWSEKLLYHAVPISSPYQSNKTLESKELLSTNLQDPVLSLLWKSLQIAFAIAPLYTRRKPFASNLHRKLGVERSHERADFGAYDTFLMGGNLGYSLQYSWWLRVHVGSWNARHFSVANVELWQVVILSKALSERLGTHTALPYRFPYSALQYLAEHSRTEDLCAGHVWRESLYNAYIHWMLCLCFEAMVYDFSW